MNRRSLRIIIEVAAALLFAVVQAHAANVHSRTTTTIPMGDGQSLAADLYQPTETIGPWPTVLIQTPYNKNLLSLAFLLPGADNPLLKSQNYAFVVLDWRGFYGSGAASYSGAPSKGEDGYDAVEWIAAQAWSTGAVGTWGESALGLVQLQTALEKPPHLSACVPMVCHLWDTYSLWFPGGVYYKNRNDFVVGYFYLGIQLFRPHPTKDLFWTNKEGQMPSYAGVTTPMLFVSGWYDHDTNVTLEEFHRVRAAQGAGSQTRLLIGPWSHTQLGQTDQGELSFPTAHFEDTRQALAFFDVHLRHVPPPPAPVVQYYQINEDAWIDATDWPPATGVTIHTYGLHDDGSLSTAPPPAVSVGRTLTSNSADPVHSLFGSILQPAEGDAQGPGDIAALIGRADTQFFQTAVLTTPLQIAGENTVHVWITSDAPDVDVAARLVEVLPDGKAILLADGMRRASLRNSFATRELLSPGVPVEVSVTIAPLAATIPAGHRLGLLIAPSNYDLWEVNPQDGHNYLDEAGAAAQVGVVTILTDAAHPSRIDLSVTGEMESGVEGWLLM